MLILVILVLLNLTAVSVIARSAPIPTEMSVLLATPISLYPTTLSHAFLLPVALKLVKYSMEPLADAIRLTSITELPVNLVLPTASHAHQLLSALSVYLPTSFQAMPVLPALITV